MGQSLFFYSSFKLIRLMYFSEILTNFGIGLFNYCTCGHCGQDGIVCLSVRSVFHSLVSYLTFLHRSALSDWQLSVVVFCHIGTLSV